MTGEEFIRRIRKLGRDHGMVVRFEARKGKGSHGRLYFGDRFATVKDRRKEISKGLLAAMLSQLAYPAKLEAQEDGAVLVSFPDIPEALTEGSTRAEALAEAADCLVAALGGYVNDRRDLPRPSPARGRPLVELPALVAAKLALYRAMREQRIGNVALARRFDTAEGTIRRLLDLDHRSHIGHVETALRALGQRLVVEARAA